MYYANTDRMMKINQSIKTLFSTNHQIITVNKTKPVKYFTDESQET